MRWFQTTYTVRFNRRHRLSGHLFQGRYKAVVVNPEERGYFVTLSGYIHLNPVRAGIVSLDERLVDYRWSSYPMYVSARRRAPWFEPRDVLAELGLEDNGPGRRRYAERMRTRAMEDEGHGAADALADRWYLGTESFKDRILRLLERPGDRLRAHREVDGPVRRTHDEAEAQRIVEAGLKVPGLAAEELGAMPKGDERKLALALLVRRHTAVSKRWIATRLHLGHVSRLRTAGAETDSKIKWLIESLEQITRFSD